MEKVKHYLKWSGQITVHFKEAEFKDLPDYVREMTPQAFKKALKVGLDLWLSDDENGNNVTTYE